MRSGFAGAAIAAVMACAGWVGSAEASVVNLLFSSVDAGSGYQFDVAVEFDFGSNNPGSISYDFHRPSPDPDLIDIGDSASFDVTQNVVGGVVQSINIYGFDPNGTQSSGSSTSIGFPVDVFLYITNKNGMLNLESFAGQAVTNFEINNPDALLTIPSSVPLPASAPLFGVAIMALGALGYTRRRLVHRPNVV